MKSRAGEELHVITGGAGFIASHLTDSLLSDGHHVLALDDLSNGDRRYVDAASTCERFAFHRIAVDDACALMECVRAVEHDQRDVTVWHLAANSDIAAGVADPEVDRIRTFETTYSLLRVMRACNLRKLVFASTSAVYGDHGTRKLSEDSGPMLPISNYGAMKLASEACISAAVEAFIERAWVFRFANVVGARATHGVMFDFIRRLRRDPSSLVVLGDGSQRKPYMHVSELIAGMRFAVERSEGRLNCYNIGPEDEGVLVRSIAEQVVARIAPSARISYGKDPKGWVGDVSRFSFSTEKLRALGWRPSMSSRAAVDRAIDELTEMMLCATP